MFMVLLKGWTSVDAGGGNTSPGSHVVDQFVELLDSQFVEQMNGGGP